MNKTELNEFLNETKERLDGRAKSNQVYESLPMRVDLFVELHRIAFENGCMHGGSPSWRTLIRKIAEGDLVVSKAEPVIEPESDDS